MAYKLLELDEQKLELIKNIIAGGKTEKQLAEILGISPSSLTYNKKQNERLREVIDNGVALQEADVVGALLKKAKGFTVIVKGYDARRGVEYTEEKYFAPDSFAIAQFLNNRSPELWKAKREEANANEKLIINVHLNGQQFKQLQDDKKKAKELPADFEVVDEGKADK